MTDREVFQSVMTSDGWQVKQKGKVLSSHGTRDDNEADAIRRAKAVHDRGGLAQVVLHRTDGQIREERTYGKDPERTPG